MTVVGWARIDDSHSEHPKVIRAGNQAELLDLRAILFANKYETDGRVLRSTLPRLSRGMHGEVQAARLVDAGRWIVAEDFDGWTIHGFLEWQLSRDERDAARAAARDRKARSRSRQRTGSRRDNGVGHASPARLKTKYEDEDEIPPTPQRFAELDDDDAALIASRRDILPSEEERELGKVNALAVLDNLRNGHGVTEGEDDDGPF